jgi:hypothetical protein
VNVHFVDNDNLTVSTSDLPDIILDLFDDLNVTRCSEAYRRADSFHEDDKAQYAKIFTASGTNRLPPESIYNTVLHEFGHTLGLGHAHIPGEDLMCSVDEEEEMTCPTLPSDDLRPSVLNVKALLFIYGTDGFGGFNRALINKPYYILSNDSKGSSFGQ